MSQSGPYSGIGGVSKVGSSSDKFLSVPLPAASPPPMPSPSPSPRHAQQLQQQQTTSTITIAQDQRGRAPSAPVNLPQGPGASVAAPVHAAFRGRFHSNEIASGSPPLREVSFVPDSMAGVCFRCKSPFTFTRRKHHCRSCGNVVCGSCSNRRASLHGVGHGTQPVRVCDPCYRSIMLKQHRNTLTRGGATGMAAQPSTTPSMDGSQQQQHHPSFYKLHLAAQQQLQPWNESQSSSGSGGWGTGIEASGRWISSFFFAQQGDQPSSTATNQTGTNATHGSGMLHINPNYMAPSSDSHPSLTTDSDGRPSVFIDPISLAQMYYKVASAPGTDDDDAEPPLLTPSQMQSLVLLLFNTYICVNPHEEKIKLHHTNIIFHILPRKHIDGMTSENEVEVSIGRRARNFADRLMEQSWEAIRAWKAFVELYDYEKAAEEEEKGGLTSLPSPPPCLPYPPAPPFCSGSLIVTNGQVCFIPDYVVYVHWSHLVLVEERRRWMAKRQQAQEMRARARARSQQSPPDPAVIDTPNMDELAEAFVTHDGGEDATPISLHRSLSVPLETDCSDTTPLAPDSAIDVPSSPATGSRHPSVTSPDSSPSSRSSMSSPQPLSSVSPIHTSLPADPDPAPTEATSDAVLLRSYSEPDLEHEADGADPHTQSRPRKHSIPHSRSVNNMTPSQSDSPPLTAVSQSSLASSATLFSSYRNLCHLHLPHYRFYQQHILGASSSPPDFDPLLFSPPLIALPLLSLRKLRSYSHENKDIGYIELKTKLHHGTLRFILPSLIRKQRFSEFRNLSKCIDFYITCQPPAAGHGQKGGTNSLPPHTATNTGMSGANGSPDLSQSEYVRKIFAFRNVWQPSPINIHSSSPPPFISPIPTAVRLASSPVDPGWLIYNAHKEYMRMGLLPTDPSQQSRHPYRLSEVNSRYTFCSSYPKSLIVPSRITDVDLQSISQFRSKQRIPSIVWAGPLPSAPVSSLRSVEPDAQSNAQPSVKARHGLILRSAQPLTGITGQRCYEDELLLHWSCAGMGTDRLLIMDARPMANALGQSAMGAGYEDVRWYTNGPASNIAIKECQIQFCNIENIHNCRKSHAGVEKLIAKLVEEEAEMDLHEWRAETGVRVHNANTRPSSSGCTNLSGASSPTPSNSAQSTPASASASVSFPSAHPSSASWLSSLHATGHFLHLAAILTSVNHALSCISQGICVLIHCSDGWDRTSLLSALAQLCLDSRYRTIEGFIVLFEKEWASFGHRFADRLGHGLFTQEVSPVFLQYLDCVKQYLIQFPTQFQFDERLLLFLADRMHAGMDGTFLFNSEYERVRYGATEKLRTCWSYVMEHVNEFLNPLYGCGWADLTNPILADAAMDVLGYEPHAAFAALPLYPDSSTFYIDVKRLQFWYQLYLGYKQCGQGLTWTWNTIAQQPQSSASTSASEQLQPSSSPSPSSTLAALSGASSSSSSSSSSTVCSSSHRGMVDPSHDVNPVHLYLDVLRKQEQIEFLQARLDQTEVDACVREMCIEVELIVTRTKMEEQRREHEADIEQAKRNIVIRATEPDSDCSSQGGNNNGTSSDCTSSSSAPSIIDVPSSDSSSSSPALGNGNGNGNGHAHHAHRSSATQPSSTTAVNVDPITLVAESSFRKSDTCFRCSAPLLWLGVPRRRHHCRRCASSVCEACCMTIPVRYWQQKELKTGRGPTADREVMESKQLICIPCSHKLAANNHHQQQQQQADSLRQQHAQTSSHDQPRHSLSTLPSSTHGHPSSGVGAHAGGPNSSVVPSSCPSLGRSLVSPLLQIPTAWCMADKDRDREKEKEKEKEREHANHTNNVKH